MFNNKYAILLALTMELVTLELVLVYAGSYLDQKVGWSGYGVMLGAGLGLGVWVFHLIVAMKKVMEKDEA
ncbi:MAG TPA: hypothetical protein VFV50_09280 [Bdellovibrionales bacterium]|nr:hypothetical protein [Bdellovibrionales bacterium]